MVVWIESFACDRMDSALIEEMKSGTCFTGVTLSSDDRQNIIAHEVILSYFSPFFIDILADITSSSIYL